MHIPVIPFDPNPALREKARLNASIARDLSDYFGGNTADYLRPLNHRLREKIRLRNRYLKTTAAAAAWR